MTIQEATLEEIRSVIRPDKKSLLRCKAGRPRRIETVFPANALLVSKTHIHLANWLAAWEFDPTPELEGAIQDGMSYVFRAAWTSETYEFNGCTYLSMEQIFDPDTDRYRFHPLCKPSYDGHRHRWNGHNGKLEVLCETSSGATGEKMLKLMKDRSFLLKRSGRDAGTYRLPRGCYSWEEKTL
jgi:hypothetical protein